MPAVCEKMQRRRRSDDDDDVAFWRKFAHRKYLHQASLGFGRKELVNKLVPLKASKSGNNPEISEIHEYCIKKKYGDDSVVQYYGEIDSEQRQKNIVKFQDPESNCKFFVGNPQTGGYGITLTAASTVGIIAGVNSLNYTSTTSYAAGGTISGTSLTLTAADGTNPGLISTGAQTIAGAKTFNNDITAPNFIGNVTGYLSGNATTASTATGASAAGAATIASICD